MGVKEFKQTPLVQADVFKKIVPLTLNYPGEQVNRFLQIFKLTKFVKLF